MEHSARLVRPLATRQGYHVCLFSYGQTGAGKTWTMTGDAADADAEADADADARPTKRTKHDASAVTKIGIPPAPTAFRSSTLLSLLFGCTRFPSKNGRGAVLRAHCFDHSSDQG